MLTLSLARGLRTLRARPGLAVLVYLVNLAVAALLAVPIAVAVGSATAASGFDAELTRAIDLVLLTDIVARNPGLVGLPLTQLLWVIPLVFAWKAALGAGLVHALRDTRSFWEGVGRYGVRSLMLSGVFLAPLLVAGVAAAILALVLSVAFPGEIALFWTWAVVVPSFLVVILLAVDLFQDYARVALVVDERPVMEAFLQGFRFPLRHGTAWWLHLAWFVPAAALWLLPTAAELALGASLVFIVQQAFLLGCAATTVGWLASEVALYAEAARRSRPVIATAAGAEPDPAAVS